MNGMGLFCIVAKTSASPDHQVCASERLLFEASDTSSGERLYILNGGPPAWLDEADEKTFKAIHCATDTVRVLGQFESRVLRLELEVRVGLLIDPLLENRLDAFLLDNPFMIFGSVAKRERAGPFVSFAAVLDLSSTAYRDVRHELPSFALRCGAEVQSRVHVETFNEDGQLLAFGDLPVEHGAIARAAIRVSHMGLGWVRRFDAHGPL
jgi:hypothetical protein